MTSIVQNADTTTNTNDFLSNFTVSAEVTIEGILLTVGLTFLTGLFIFFIYKRCYSGVVFNKNFGASLILLGMVTAAAVTVVSTNLAVGLGMVGALSIVRFRTAVKETIDTIFMFWSIGEGILIGAQLYTEGLIFAVGIGIVMVVISLFKQKSSSSYVVVLRFEEGAKNEVQGLLRKFPQGKLKSKTVSRGIMELTIEMKLSESDINMVDNFGHIPGVYDASVISYSGDIVS